MVLSTEAVNAYKEILSNPVAHGFSFKPLNECFETSDKVTAKHILFQQFIEQIKKPLPKVIFYILMDEMYSSTIGKDEQGNLGYALTLV